MFFSHEHFLYSDGVTPYDLLLQERDYIISAESNTVQENTLKFNQEQRAIFDIVCEAIDNNNNKNLLLFIDGPGGCGKSFLLNTILARVRADAQIGIAVASSGIASLLLTGGRTAHSRFNIPRELHEESMCHISKRTQLEELIRHAKVIIWDEVVMVHRHAIEAVDRTLQDLMENKEPFGGKLFIFAGDFR